MYINLTPHDVVLIPEGGQMTTTRMGDVGDRIVLRPSGTVVRIAETVSHEPYGLNGTTTVTLGEVDGLPPLDGWTMYVVSMPVLMALAAKGVSRPDLVYPFGQVRDETGRIIGCRALARLEIG